MVKKVYSIDDLEDYLGGEDEPALFKGKPFTGVLVEDHKAWDYYESSSSNTQTSEDLRLIWETTFKKGEEVCCNIYSDILKDASRKELHVLRSIYELRKIKTQDEEFNKIPKFFINLEGLCKCSINSKQVNTFLFVGKSSFLTFSKNF